MPTFETDPEHVRPNAQIEYSISEQYGGSEQHGLVRNSAFSSLKLWLQRNGEVDRERRAFYNFRDLLSASREVRKGRVMQNQFPNSSLPASPSREVEGFFFN